MRVEQEMTPKGPRILLWLNAAEYEDLVTKMHVLDRIALDEISSRGLDGLVLDFPRNRFVAVYDPNEQA